MSSPQSAGCLLSACRSHVNHSPSILSPGLTFLSAYVFYVVFVFVFVFVSEHLFLHKQSPFLSRCLFSLQLSIFVCAPAIGIDLNPFVLICSLEAANLLSLQFHLSLPCTGLDPRSALGRGCIRGKPTQEAGYAV